MRSKVVLKPGKKGEETAKNTTKANTGILYDYVKQATLRSAQIRSESDVLAYDYESLEELVQAYEATKKVMAGLDPKKDKARLKQLAELQKARGKIVNEYKGKETDFDGALKTSREWASKTPVAVAEANEHRTNIEMLYERAQGMSGTDTGRVEAQEASMSVARLDLQHQQFKDRVHQLEKLERVQGLGGKTGDALSTGAMSFLLSVATMGIVAIEKQTNPLGYMGKGWTHHSKMPKAGAGKGNILRRNLSTRQFETGGKEESNEDKKTRLVLMEDLFGKIEAVKKLLSDRKGGASALDWISAVLMFVGDGILQSLITVGSRVAIWLGAVAGILTLINIPAHGALSPVIAVMSALALAITYVRLALAGLKLIITGARLAVDSLNMAINNDPRMARALQARTMLSGTGVAGDTLQVGGVALAGAGMSLATFGEATNPFNPVADAQHVGATFNDTAGHATLGQAAAGSAMKVGGAAAGIVGVDVLKPATEGLSSRAGLYNAEHRYLSGSNPKSQKHKEGSGYQGPAQGPSQPNWLSEGILEQEKQGAQRATYLKVTADQKVIAVKNAVADPAALLQGASDTAKSASDKLDAAKAIITGTKKDELPPNAVEATQDDAKDAGKTAEVLGGTAKTLAAVGDVAKDGVDTGSGAAPSS